MPELLTATNREATESSDRDWLIPMALIAAVQLGIWCLLWSNGNAKQPMLVAYSAVAVIGLGFALIPYSLWHLFRIYRAGDQSPISRIRKDLSASRIGSIILATLLASIMASAFTAAKSAIPFVMPFYLDPPLAHLERAVFTNDPWRISHELLGWATPAIDRFYLTWLPVMLVGFNLVLLSKPSKLKTQSLISYLLLWPAVGTLGSYLFSSAGPIFYDAIVGGGFADLLPTLRHEGATGSVRAYDLLWRNYAGRDPTLGGGISAMPSMHVALATWLALTVRSKFPQFRWLGWSYLTLIWIGSVHLGWHYVTDGLVGAIGAIAIWKVAPHVVSPEKSEKAH